MNNIEYYLIGTDILKIKETIEDYGIHHEGMRIFTEDSVPKSEEKKRNRLNLIVRAGEVVQVYYG